MSWVSCTAEPEYWNGFILLEFLWLAFGEQLPLKSFGLKAGFSTSSGPLLCFLEKSLSSLPSGLTYWDSVLMYEACIYSTSRA